MKKLLLVLKDYINHKLLIVDHNTKVHDHIYSLKNSFQMANSKDDILSALTKSKGFEGCLQYDNSIRNSISILFLLIAITFGVVDYAFSGVMDSLIPYENGVMGVFFCTLAISILARLLQEDAQESIDEVSDLAFKKYYEFEYGFSENDQEDSIIEDDFIDFQRGESEKRDFIRVVTAEMRFQDDFRNIKLFDFKYIGSIDETPSERYGVITGVACSYPIYITKGHSNVSDYDMSLNHIYGFSKELRINCQSDMIKNFVADKLFKKDFVEWMNRLSDMYDDFHFEITKNGKVCFSVKENELFNGRRISSIEEPLNFERELRLGRTNYVLRDISKLVLYVERLNND